MSRFLVPLIVINERLAWANPLLRSVADAPRDAGKCASRQRALLYAVLVGRLRLCTSGIRASNTNPLMIHSESFEANGCQPPFTEKSVYSREKTPFIYQ